jgi:hypothetical protein
MDPATTASSVAGRGAPVGQGRRCAAWEMNGPEEDPKAELAATHGFTSSELNRAWIQQQRRAQWRDEASRWGKVGGGRRAAWEMNGKR